MIKFTVFLITFAISITGCNFNQSLQKNSTNNDEKVSRDEIPVDFLRIIENAQTEDDQQFTNTPPPESGILIDDIPLNFSELPQSEQELIRNQIRYSADGEFRERSDINGIYKDIFEYDLPPKRGFYSNEFGFSDNVFDYGIPFTGGIEN